MKNIAFCTLAYGEKYVSLSDDLIKCINDLGYHIFVLTNDLSHYSNYDPKMVTSLVYSKPYFSFHEKKEVMKECLKKYETAFFLDCDVFLKDANDISVFEDISPGLHIFSTFGAIDTTFLNQDVGACENENQRNTKYGNAGRLFLEKMGYLYKRDYQGIEGHLEHYLEGRWIIKKDRGLEDKFFEIWDDIAEFSEQEDMRMGFNNNIGAGEGSAMSIAAFNSGIKINMYQNINFVNKHFISNYRRKLQGEVPWTIAG